VPMIAVLSMVWAGLIKIDPEPLMAWAQGHVLFQKKSIKNPI
jgi:hypothetical protein